MMNKPTIDEDRVRAILKTVDAEVSALGLQTPLERKYFRLAAVDYLEHEEDLAEAYRRHLRTSPAPSSHED